tara:strand:+ start:649 stop:1116 length:468 start_codon:yes stop_codon:yes gene_type:complete
MNIGEIAQILTGVATLFVAIVLVLQLRKQNQQLEIQNKENQREIILRNAESHLNRQSIILSNPEFRKIFLKRTYDIKDLSEEEYLALTYYFTSILSTFQTGFKIDKDRDTEDIKIFLNNIFSNSKLARHWYKNHNWDMWDKEFIKICDEVYNKYL